MTWTLQIKLESLADGPGILPYHLGEMKLTTHHHTFLQYINLNDIEEKINLVHGQLLTYRDRLINDTFAIYEIQIDYLINRLDKVLAQLRTLEPNRSKRGLVDGLGSIIKSVTGNLDYSDAIKYNEAIKLLQNNQDKMVSDLNNHLSISKEWMLKHNNALEQLIINQGKINSTLELILNSSAYRETNLIKYARFAQLLEIASENTEDLMQELLRIENALAFIRLSTTHHTMIDINLLQIMISKIKSLYGSDYVPNLQLRDYYDIIKPGSYYADKMIVIIFNFPIISRDKFDFYKLSIAPNKDNQGLIPPSPYIATNGNSFVYIETECPKFNNWFLCEENINYQIRTKLDCIKELITNQILEESCQFTKITLKKEAMEKLDDQHYVLSFPQETKAQLVCDRIDHTTLNGSYLVTIPGSCYLKTMEFTIINENDEVKGQPLKLVKIPYSDQIRSPEETHIQLSSVNLEDLHSIQDKIMVQAPLQLNQMDPSTMYHTTIPFYSIILLSGFILLIIYVSRRPELRTCNKERNKKEQCLEDQTSKGGSSIEMPATFSLNVLK